MPDVEIVSVSRRGRPKGLEAGTWADQVQWAEGDALDTERPWRSLLEGDDVGVVSTLGAFGSTEKMYRTCGVANMELIRAAKEAGVRRFAFISVHDFRFPNFLLKGYFQGKRDAEQELFEQYPETGVALRPGFIYGSRDVGSGTLPLGIVGAPLGLLLKALPTRRLADIPILGAAFVPPTPVDVVGRAAARAALDPSIPGGIMDVWSIAEYGKRP
ncbi:hypothetical protein QBZ16_000694 [Prototheca wickerhamii]|uniref:NAD(P)-binding domain-containing protein n=1 Tax=Prototheca wickerhamii TaxID=3111 RepID=A0AAD9IPA4_PROWI|nr:hypothetical protein QBZ16_000694 [Prototheca wickerhamii]